MGILRGLAFQEVRLEPDSVFTAVLIVEGLSLSHHSRQKHALRAGLLLVSGVLLIVELAKAMA